MVRFHHVAVKLWKIFHNQERNGIVKDAIDPDTKLQSPSKAARDSERAAAKAVVLDAAEDAMWDNAEKILTDMIDEAIGATKEIDK